MLEGSARIFRVNRVKLAEPIVGEAAAYREVMRFPAVHCIIFIDVVIATILDFILPLDDSRRVNLERGGLGNPWLRDRKQAGNGCDSNSGDRMSAGFGNVATNQLHHSSND